MNGKIERVKKRIDEIKREREELKEKYDYLVEEMKKVIDKHSQDIESLKNAVKGITDKEGKGEGEISNVRSLVNSLGKKIATIGGKQSILKEKLREEVELMGGKLDSEISERIKIIQSKLVDDLKIEIEKNLEGLGTLEKDVRKTEDKHDKFEEKISNLRSLINPLAKSLSNLENKQSNLKEKLVEDIKSVSRDLNSQLTEKMKGMNADLKTSLRDLIEKNIGDIRLLEKDTGRILEEYRVYGERFPQTEDDINSIKKSMSELSGMHNVLKSGLNERVNLFEKEIMSELAKVKGFEERLGKDIEDFEKFAGEQKSGMEKFESKVSGKIDMFAVEKENLKRDFSSLSNDFKNIGGRLDSFREKDSDLNQHLQNLELDTENFKKMTEEILGKVKEEQSIFKENFVAKLNEASDKMLNRISQNELGTSSELAKQSEDIKLFRAHVTQFINDLVSNYERRFDMMKDDIDQALRLMEEKAKEQKAMIFE